MARAFACLALLAVGCGGALAGDPGTGGMGSAGTTGIGGAGGGAAGTTGIGGTGGGAAGRSPYEGSYTWGDVTVQVESLAASPTGLYLVATDDSTLDITETMFPAATRLSPSDGAYARVVYGGCGNTTVESVEVYSCADPGSATMAPGCFSVLFRPIDLTGALVLPDGSKCLITGASGSIGLPAPSFATPPPAQVATAIGNLTLDCASSAGIRRHMTASFAIPVSSSFLLCAGSD